MSATADQPAVALRAYIEGNIDRAARHVPAGRVLLVDRTGH